MAKPIKKTVDRDTIKQHPDFQMRVAGLDRDHAEQIAEAVRRREKLPPIKCVAVEEKGGELYAVDGHHELLAYELAGRKMVPVEVTVGTWSDAVRLAAAANKKNLALPRKGADKRRAVEMMLKTDGRKMTNGMIAHHVGVSDEFVRQVRKEMPEELAPTVGASEPEVVQGRGGRTYKRTKAGGVGGETWRDMPLDEFLDAPAKVFKAVEAAKLKTAGDVWDALNAGETFGLTPTDKGNLFSAVAKLRSTTERNAAADPKANGKHKPGVNGKEVFPWREANAHLAKVARLPDDVVRAYPEEKGSELVKVLGRLLDEVVDAVKKLEKRLGKKNPGKE